MCSNVSFKCLPGIIMHRAFNSGPTILEIMIGTTDLKLMRNSNFLLKNLNSPSPQTMLMIICTNPTLLLTFSSQHWTGGEVGDGFLGNLVNCDDHVLLYTGVPMNFDQDCTLKHYSLCSLKRFSKNICHQHFHYAKLQTSLLQCTNRKH